MLEKYKKSPRLLQKIPPKLNSFIFISLYISLYILSVDDNDTLCLCLKEKIDPLPLKKVKKNPAKNDKEILYNLNKCPVLLT